jgi:hypothetical protein
MLRTTIGPHSRLCSSWEDAVIQKLFATVAFAFITLAAASDARALGLDILAGGGTLTSDNGFLTFSEFEVITSGSVRSDLALYDVSALTDGLAITGPFAAAGGAIGDMFLSFTVTSTKAITNASLRFNGAASGAGASASVTESFEEIEDGDLFVYSLGKADRDLVDQGEIDDLTTLSVSKDILVDSGSSGIAVISRIEQRFTTDAPEPAGMLLFGMAFLGIAALRRNLQ